MATLKVKVLDFLNLEGLDGDICDDYDESFNFFNKFVIL
jgi:hypothetical protein